MITQLWQTQKALKTFMHNDISHYFIFNNVKTALYIILLFTLLLTLYIVPSGEGGGGGSGSGSVGVGSSNVAYAEDLPTITAASVDSASSITLTYSENVDVATTAGQGFALSVGVVSANSDPAGLSDTIVLTVSGIATTSDTPDVIYTASQGSVTDESANAAEDQTIGTVDSAPPTVVSIETASTTTINLILSEEITVNSAAPGDFVLSGDITTSPTVNAITADNDIVTLTLSDALDDDDVISLEYSQTTGSINDIALPPFVDSFSVRSQETSPTDLAFSADGAKMFVVGFSGDDVNEYDLSQPFDVSTASFVDAFSVRSQESFPHGLAFSADGAKMFVVGTNGDDVNEYDLSQPFDVSTASFVDSFSVRSQDTDPRGLAFSADGAKMFVVGDAGNDVNEYDLSQPFDVSTASFVDAFSVRSQETSPSGLAFSTSGAKMFVVGFNGDRVSEYDLSQPFDVSTASFVYSFSVRSQDTSPSGLAISADGSKMFVLGFTDKDVNEYTLAKPFTILPNSLASFAASPVANNIVILPSITAASVDSASSITLTYNENIDVATTAGQGFALSTGTVSANSDPAGLTDTIVLTVSGITTSDTPDVTYTVSSGTVTDVSSNSAEDQTFTGTVDNAPPTVSSFATLSNTAISLRMSEPVSDESATPSDFVLSGDITANPTVYAIAADGDTVTLFLSGMLDSDDIISLAYTQSTGSIDDTASPSFVDSFSVSSQDPFPRDLAFSTNGYKMFVVGLNGRDVNEYALAAPFDVSSASFVDSLSVSSQDTFPHGLAFSTNGAKMFVVGNTGDDVNEYDLSQPFDVSTAVFVDSFSVTSQITDPRGLAFSADGAKMFVVGVIDQDVNEYTLAAPFDVSTAVFVDSFSVSSQDTFPSGLAFSTNGDKMFVAGRTGDDVNEYTLATHFDVSTAVFVDSFSVRSQDTDPRGLAFSANGEKMFVVGNIGDDVNEYTLRKPFTILPNSLASFAAATVTNNLITPPTRITAASVDSADTITVTYNENVDVTTTNGQGFSLSAGEVTANSDPGGLSDIITLTVSGITTTSDTPDVIYTASSGTVINALSIPAEDQTFTDTTDNAPPTVVSIVTAGPTTINLTLSEEITVNSPAPEDFVLSGDITTSPTVDTITADNDIVTLTLSGMLDDDDLISLAYSKSTGSIDDTVSPSFDSSFSVSSQETSPTGIAFSADGGKMFVTGNLNDDVNEYTLTTPFDVSTAVFVDSFSVRSQDISPQGLAFSANGDKMFVVGNDGDNVNEYTLTTTFDVSTATFAGSFSVASQETSPRGLAFSADGGKMFVTGNLNDNVNEYTLTTPFDVSTAVFDSSFSVRSQDTNPYDLAFSANGEKMFVVGGSGDDINEYTLAAPFDVSTAVFDGSFPVRSQDTSPRGLTFSADGDKMFVVGGSGDDVNEYTLRKLFTLFPNSLASFAAATVTNNLITLPRITAASVDSASSITLTYNENIDVTTTNGQGFTLSDGTIHANSDPAGSSSIITLTVSGLTTSDTPDVIYTASSGTVTDVSSNPAEDQTFTDTVDNAPPTVVSIETASTTTINLTLSEEITVNSAAPEDFVLSGDITTSPTVDTITANNDIVTLTLSGALDYDDDINLAYSKSTGSIGDTTSPSSFVDSFSVASQDSSPTGLAFSADGSKMFVVGSTGDDVNEYTLSTPFDVSTATFVDSFSVVSQIQSPAGLAFSADGSKMFVLDFAVRDVNEYTLATPFDVSTAVFDSSFSVFSQEASPRGLAFSADGAKMFVVGNTGDDVNEYTLSTPFDVSSSSFAGSFSVGSQELDPRGLAFSADGSKMFVVGSSGDDVNEYTLTTPFDVSSASFAGSFSVASQDTFPHGIAFSADGSKMFVVGSLGQDVNEYTLAKPFTILPNSLASFAASPVTNNIAPPPDVTPPRITAASVDSADTITVTYSEDVDVTTTNGAGFSLSVGEVTANSDPGGLSDIITLTVSGITTTSDTPDVTYTATSGTVEDGSSNPAEDQTIGTTDNAPPTVLSIGTASPTTINLILSEEITLNATAPGDFVLSGEISTDPTVTAIAAAGDTVTLTLSGTLDSDDVINLAYTQSTGSIDDIALASFAGSFSVSSEDTFPAGLAFSADGTKMFVVGIAGQDVNEYTLTTPFDVSAATFVDSFSVVSQETSPAGLAFSADGAKMFVVGVIGQDVNEYTLSAPFDVSSAVFVDSFSVSSQEIISIRPGLLC